MPTAATYLLGLEMVFWSSWSITFPGPVVPRVLFPALEDWSDFCFSLVLCTPLPAATLCQQWRLALQGQQPAPSALMGVSHQAHHV